METATLQTRPTLSRVVNWRLATLRFEPWSRCPARTKHVKLDPAGSGTFGSQTKRIDRSGSFESECEWVRRSGSASSWFTAESGSGKDPTFAHIICDYRDDISGRTEAVFVEPTYERRWVRRPDDCGI